MDPFTWSSKGRKTSSLIIQDVARKTSRERWAIEAGGERRSGKFMLSVRLNDDDTIIIKKRHQHGYPWSSPATLLYRPSLPVGLQGYILLYVCSSWSSYLCSSMWRGPLEYVTSEFVPTSPAVSRMSGSSNLDGFRDGWYYLPTPPLGQDMTQGQFLSGV